MTNFRPKSSWQVPWISNECRVPKPVGADVGDVFCYTSHKIVVDRWETWNYDELWGKHHRTTLLEASFYGMAIAAINQGVPSLAHNRLASVAVAQSWFAASWQPENIEGPCKIGFLWWRHKSSRETPTWNKLEPT